MTIFSLSMFMRKWRKWYQMHPWWPTNGLEVERPFGKNVDIQPLEHNIYEGSCQCGRCRCKSCAYVRIGADFTCLVTGNKFSARVCASCKTSNIIYLIQCHKCKMQYVAKTKNPLHLRMNGHGSDYYCRLPDKPVAEHFSTYPAILLRILLW